MPHACFGHEKLRRYCSRWMAIRRSTSSTSSGFGRANHYPPCARPTARLVQPPQALRGDSPLQGRDLQLRGQSSVVQVRSKMIEQLLRASSPTVLSWDAEIFQRRGIPQANIRVVAAVRVFDGDETLAAR